MRNLLIISVTVLLASGYDNVSGSDDPHGAKGFDKYHHTKGVPKLNYDSLFMEAVPINESAEGQTIIRKCIESYGGGEKLESLRNFRLTYRMKPYLSGDTIEVTKSFAADRKYKIVRDPHGRYEERILNGARAWFQSLDTLMVIDSGRYKAELFSYLTLSLPLSLENERFDEVRYGTRSGDSLSYIYMVKQDTLMIIAGIDPEDGYIKSSEGIIWQGRGHFIFINYFSDFRNFDGYIFPGYLGNVSMGLEVARSRLEAVVVNEKIGEDEFNPNRQIQKRKSY
ncbi:MAG: hypothetical protein JSW64_10255 [Candidatus Zixiibacteriota bacterium]|nr:MAG: hypothetical protein JSW64_10255 [candidate division Zixibacteria bacterium]